jgi:hypothetical protein
MLSLSPLKPINKYQIRRIELGQAAHIGYLCTNNDLSYRIPACASSCTLILSRVALQRNESKWESRVLAPAVWYYHTL